MKFNMTTQKNANKSFIQENIKNKYVNQIRK